MEYLLAKYYIKTKKNLKEVAEKIAREETTGNWVGETPPTELFKKAQAYVRNIEEISKGEGIIEINFPVINLNLSDPFSAIWLFLTGGPVFEYPDYQKVRLLDFELPKVLLKKFPGPKFGIKGTRKIMNLKENDLIIGTIIKPCAGLTPEEVARKCYEAAVAGVNFIKDDEKMNNPEYCPLKKKVKLVSKALKKAYEETGNKVIYAPHITTRPDKIKDAAKIAIECGATALMFNYLAAGFASLQILAEDKDISVPIYAHSGGRSIFSRVAGQGIDSRVIAKFVRLCGGDYFQIGVIGGYLLGTKKEMLEFVKIFREKIDSIKDTVPVVAGGLTALNLIENIKTFGIDIMGLAGTSILNHPLGIKAGVKAFHLAKEAYFKKIPLREYAKEHIELKILLKEENEQ